MCNCGIPNKANFHLLVIWDEQGETGYTDIYLCGDHTPNIPEGDHDFTSEPYAWRGADVSKTGKSIGELLKWDGSERAVILGYTLTELR
jgi:hypothetical protein